MTKPVEPSAPIVLGIDGLPVTVGYVTLWCGCEVAYTGPRPNLSEVFNSIAHGPRCKTWQHNRSTK